MLDTTVQLLTPVLDLCKTAGAAILSRYQQADLKVQIKADKTPVTCADALAHDILIAGLAQLTPELPILSEESPQIEHDIRMGWSQYWLLDPLDGTQGFIDQTGEFSVNVALVQNGEPILGVVYVPLSGEAYVACCGMGAFKYTAAGDFEFLQARRYQTGMRLAIAISRWQGKRTQAFLRKIPDYELVYCGSALKICYVAEGRADIYPRLGPTGEWDTAAGQCILREAGGEIFDLQGQPLRYNTRRSTENPPFLAVGDCQHNWNDYFTLLEEKP